MRRGQVDLCSDEQESIFRVGKLSLFSGWQNVASIEEPDRRRFAIYCVLFPGKRFCAHFYLRRIERVAGGDQRHDCGRLAPPSTRLIVWPRRRHPIDRRVSAAKHLAGHPVAFVKAGTAKADGGGTQVVDVAARWHSTFAGTQLEAAAGRLTALIEPVLSLVLAVFVCFLLLATILPILQAGNLQG